MFIVKVACTVQAADDRVVGMDVDIALQYKSCTDGESVLTRDVGISETAL